MFWPERMVMLSCAQLWGIWVILETKQAALKIQKRLHSKQIILAQEGHR